MSTMIQIRRGNKADLPELGLGELAFTQDTRELYTGTKDGNVLLTRDLNAFITEYEGFKDQALPILAELTALREDLSNEDFQAMVNDAKNIYAQTDKALADSADAVATSEDVEQRFNLVIQASGEDVPEVMDARMGEQTLRAYNQKVAAQLAEKASHSDLASVASGAPKGTYPTLVDLQTAFPTGNTNIYLVMADGKWYYWNQLDAWTAGGVYQATGIAPNSVSADKVDFINKSTNKFNNSTIVKGQVVSGANGTLTASTYYNTSDFIGIKSSTSYTYLGLLYVAYYDANKVFINRIQISTSHAQTTLTSPATAQFEKVSYQPANSPLQQINEGTSLLPFEDYYTKLSKDVEVEVDTDGLVLGVENVDFIERTSNLFNAYVVSTGQAIDTTTGALYAKSDYNTSEYIEVTPSTDYSYYGFLRVAYYDANKSFISRINMPIDYTGGTYKTPANAKFKRVHYQPALSSKQQVNKGATLLAYEKASFRLTPKLNLELDSPELMNRVEDLESIVGTGVRKLMLDVPVDGVFHTDEIYADYTEFGTSKHDEVYAMWDELMAAYPSYITRKLWGNNAEGLPIYTYTFKPARPNSTTVTKVPKGFITCGVHGYEHATTLVTYLMFKQMCEQWSEYPLLEALKYNMDCIVMPVANPTGWDAYTRKNGNQVDINRNFPYQWTLGDNPNSSQYGGPAPLSELESQIIMEVFNENPDIDFFYDFHNFHELEVDEQFIWIPTAGGELVEHMAQNLISRMTRKWKQEFSFIPDDTFIGYTNKRGDGMIQNYASSIGIKYTGAIEIRYRWKLDPDSVPYNQDMCKSGVEMLANWLLINLKELTK